MTSNGGQRTALTFTRPGLNRIPRNGRTSAMRKESFQSMESVEPAMPSPKKVRLARGGRRRVYQGSDDWGLIARIYDLEQPSCRGQELAFWCVEAAAAGGELLELAAGSGRVAIALARKGYHVTGVELSAGMLERARKRTSRMRPEVRERLTWV